LDEEIDPEECIPLFGLCLWIFSKEEIPCIEEKDLLSLFFDL
jgi:hypothetical protein